MSEIFSSQKTQAKTTNEMDGLFTQEDIDNKDFIMGQCNACTQWSKWDTRIGKWKCLYCAESKYDMRGSRSIRSWLITKDLKKVRASKKNNRA